MPDFTYQALDRSGAVTQGTISATDPTEAAVKVRSLGVYPTQITNGSRAQSASATAQGTARAASSGSKKVARLQVLLFTREMADLLDAGLPMDRAFTVLSEQTDNEALREMMVAMRGDIRAGQPLSEALKRYPREFAPLYVNMVRAGEVSGQLPSVMARLAEFMEKEQVRRSQLMAALTYPAVLICVAVLAVTFLLTFVIPKLSGVFKDMGATLPLPTVVLLAVSAFIGKYWWAIVIGLVIAVYGVRAWLVSATGRVSFDTFRLRSPMLGVLTQKIVSSRFARTLGTLLAGGVPILEAMEICASAVGNVVTEASVLEARSAVRQGETLHGAMDKEQAFLPVVRHMTAVGEETGRLPAMLLRTADTLDFEVDNAMRRLTSLVEPLVVLLMGGFVGFVVLSILLPIFQANNLAK